jgi:pimeloyl-ACP methyl ester carboxylesterase
LPYPYEELPSHKVEALGISTSFIAAGQGNSPLVVLLHGMSTSADVFREVMHELSDEFWLIAPDIPGFGESENTEPYTLPHLVEWLASFREVLNLPAMMVVGHSFGGALATNFTISYPQEVTRLLLAAPAIFAADLLPDFLKRLEISTGFVDFASTLSRSSALQESQSGRPFYDPDKIDESVWPRRLNSFDQARATSGVLKALAFHNISSELSEIRQPVCVVWGKNDIVLPSAHAQQIAEELPDASVYVWNECGHLPFLEKQEEFLAIARRFLGGEEAQWQLRNRIRKG